MREFYIVYYEEKASLMGVRMACIIGVSFGSIQLVRRMYYQTGSIPGLFLFFLFDPCATHLNYIP